MKIKQLQTQPIGQKIGGFTLSIKTYKKNWQSGKFWWQQVICMDETGEMPVDVKTGLVYNPIRGRANAIHVIVAKVQEAEYLGKDRKKLIVDQFSIPTITYDQGQELEAEQWKQHQEDEIKGKIRHGLVCAALSRGDHQINKIEILKLQDFIMTGE